MTAEHAVERDEVGRCDRASKRKKVSVQELDPPGLAATLSFQLSRLHVRLGRVDMHGRADPAGQEFMMEHPDASANVEERIRLNPGFAQQAKELPGGARCTAPSVGGELLLRSCRPKVAISGFAMARHERAMYDAA